MVGDDDGAALGGDVVEAARLDAEVARVQELESGSMRAA